MKPAPAAPLTAPLTAPWEAIAFAETLIQPGERVGISLPLGQLPTDAQVDLPVIIIHGDHPGPTVWINAAIHGDEINGVEIVRSTLARIDPVGFCGTLIAVPVVNVFGFLHQSRYTPDRRDLNRSFPGSAKGSLAARIAHLFMSQIVERCDYGIDLHTGSDHRTNLPHVRCNLYDEGTRQMAIAFNAPVMTHARTREGTLRKAAIKLGKQVLLFEAGESMRLDELSIEVGREGILRVLAHLGMRPYERATVLPPSVQVGRTSWVRARRAGILRLFKKSGELVEKREELGSIEDILGNRSVAVRAPCEGIIIGHAVAPLVYQGDAIVHLGRLRPEDEEEE